MTYTLAAEETPLRPLSPEAAKKEFSGPDLFADIRSWLETTPVIIELMDYGYDSSQDEGMALFYYRLHDKLVDEKFIQAAIACGEAQIFLLKAQFGYEHSDSVSGA